MQTMIPIQRGLDLPIAGQPVQDIKPGPPISRVALNGNDYLGMRPTMLVQVGDRIKAGQPVLSDKRTEGVIYTAPCSGIVTAINRGAKRAFQTIEFAVEGDEAEEFDRHENLNRLTRDAAKRQLLESGQWTALRARPFDKVASPQTVPHSIFVTAMDTNPLAPEPELIIDRYKDLFVSGLQVVRLLTDGKTFVCTRGDSRVPGKDVLGVEFHSFIGPHPAGLPGTHIHFLDPVGPAKTVWYIGYQDVIAIGHLFRTGRIMVDRVISLAGPRVSQPGLITTRLGASLSEIVARRADLKNARVISGSVLCGRIAEAPFDYLGRYHLQVSVLEEGNKRDFLGWQKPGADKFSVTRAFLGSWLNKRFSLTTSTEGSKRAMVPIGTYERVMPLDILATPLLRALIVNDTEQAQALGCLELGEEDVALCTYVCPGKYDYGQILRDNLLKIEREG